MRCDWFDRNLRSIDSIGYVHTAYILPRPSRRVVGFVTRTEKECLPGRVVVGELVGGKGYSGRQQNDTMVRLEEDVTGFSVNSEGCGESVHIRPADGFDGSRRGRRHSCGNDTT